MKWTVTDSSSYEPAGRDNTHPNSSKPKLPMRDRLNGSTNSENCTHLLEDDPMEHWADVDNRPIDFETTTLPPQLRTLTAEQIETCANAFKELSTIQIGTCQSDTPDGKMIQGHTFWGAPGKRVGIQRYVLSRADTLSHKVCVILEYHGRRLYSSFQDRFTFWQYYSSFQGDRCFYWINRSFECPKESTLLHLDIGWHTSRCDPAASKK